MTDASTALPILGDRYQLNHRIARGGMADIFAAHDQVLDRTVAVKIMFRHYASDPTFVERFKREARSAAGLSHPNVVAVYDWGTYDETYFIVMELIDGYSLAEILEQDGTVEPGRAVDISRQVASALEFAHQQGTLHRDIKPGNILITPRGQVKVADFGIARPFDADDTLTDAGHVVGTAGYFSPEQAQGQTLDQRSDLYSLGVVLFEMLTGRRPFTGDSPVAVAFQHVEEAPPTVRSLAPEVPEELDAIAAVLLSKDANDRYPTASDLIADLDRVGSGLPLASPVDPMSTSADRPTTTLPVGPPTPPPNPPLAPRRVLADEPAVPPEALRQRYHDEHDLDDFDDVPATSRWFIGALFSLLAVAGGLIYLASQIIADDAPPDTVSTSVEVPNVIGQDQETATHRLEDQGLEVAVRFETTDAAEAGTVLAQNPEQGEQLLTGSTVSLLVAAGDDTVAVPDVTGMPLEQARNQLESLGFEVTVTEQASSDVAAGTVISQSINPDESANDGAPITLTVSNGQPEQVVPMVTGSSEAAAITALTNAGFEVRVNPVDGDSGDAGAVVGQDPEGGNRLAAGSVVRIDVARSAPAATTARSTTTRAPTTTRPPATSRSSTTTAPQTTRSTSTTTAPEPSPTTGSTTTAPTSTTTTSSGSVTPSTPPDPGE
ncbi:MAG: Stk1 family PASTA domain-containing Ser/Thr kinase [Acidimicrobiales bacterium]